MAEQINAGGGGGGTVGKFTLSSAQILSSNSSPINLIPAPGANKLILVSSFIAKITFGTVAYATHVGASLMYGATGNEVGTNAIDLSVTASAVFMASGGFFISDLIDSLVNQPLVFITNNGNPTDGDSTIDLIVTYSIVDVS